MTTNAAPGWSSNPLAPNQRVMGRGKSPSTSSWNFVSKPEGLVLETCQRRSGAKYLLETQEKMRMLEEPHTNESGTQRHQCFMNGAIGIGAQTEFLEAMEPSVG